LTFNPEAALPLTQWDMVVLNSSAGKDSAAMMDRVVAQADHDGLPRTRISVLHCDLGREEWPGTKELAQEHAAHYGLDFHVYSRNKHSLLEEVRQRRKWPSSTARYCTSYYKREPGLRYFTFLGKASYARILNCYGFRAEESPARKKKPVFERYKRACTGQREVWNWLPIHAWTEEQVWERIRQAGTRPHPAYAIGMPRLSCRFCIFAPRAALILSGKHNPELLADYVQVEKEIGHTFRKELSLADIQAAVERGEDAGPMTGAWNM
jgi:3'-phosphoadenosine 5'-phosphosulfate sulfotransferase (PAPS reductase)/FAD synthetase